jgi:hypothetical protein
MSLHFSACSSSMLYVAGLDHEVYAGRWASSQQLLNARNLERAAFRGDSRWVGLARTSDPEGTTKRGGDNLVGITESAQLYVLRQAHLQNGPLTADEMTTGGGSGDVSAAAAASAGTSGSAASAAPRAIGTAAAEAARRRREEVAAQRKERVAAGLSALTPEEQEAKRKKVEDQRQARKRKAEAAGHGAEAGDASPRKE